MILEKFREEDYAQLIQWINSEELNYLWGGPSYTFPLTIEKIRKHCSQKDVFPYIFRVESANAGFIELVRESDRHFRIARVFIAEFFRGKRLAKVLLEQALTKAEDEFNARRLSLAVYEHNVVARSCYESIGFSTVNKETSVRSSDGKSQSLLRMEMNLPKSCIREAISDDIEQVYHLSLQLGYDSGSHEDALRRLQIILNSHTDQIWVYETKGRIQGWLHLFTAVRLASPEFAEIGGLVVDTRYRRSGIGTALIRHAVSWSTSNLLPLRVRCNNKRDAANRFYALTGFKQLKNQNVYQFKQ